MARHTATAEQIQRVRSYEWSLTRFCTETGLSFSQACKIRRGDSGPVMPPRADLYDGWPDVRPADHGQRAHMPRFVPDVEAL